jgi:hypothetical protein
MRENRFQAKNKSAPEIPYLRAVKWQRFLLFPSYIFLNLPELFDNFKGHWVTVPTFIIEIGVN